MTSYAIAMFGFGVLAGGIVGFFLGGFVMWRLIHGKWVRS